MPWRLERREGRWCVIKESDNSVSGCHDSRASAIKQQRALYANESRMASMYDELDSQPEEPVPASSAHHPAPPPSTLSPLVSELVGLLLRDDRERSLTASIAQSNAVIADHLNHTAEERQALVAALERIGQPIVNVPAPVVNVAPPEVNVEPPQVTVESPSVTVEAPNVRVEAAKQPDIHIHQPAATRQVKFERDPLTGQVSGAEVTES